MTDQNPSLPRHHIRNRYLLASDVCLFSTSVIVSFALRFEGFEWGAAFSHAALVYVVVSLPLKLLVYWEAGLYRRLWRHAGVLELERLIVASGLSSFLCIVLGGFVLPLLGLTEVRVPFAVLFMDALLSAAAGALPRVLLRTVVRRGTRRGRDDA